MDRIDALARVFSATIRGAARAGFAPARKLTAAEVRGSAHLLSAGSLGVVWQTLRRAPPWDAVSRAWERALDTPAVGPRLYGHFDPNDRVELVTDNRAAFDARARLYANARRSIDLATYYLQADDTGRATARALADAVARGVRVRLVADAYILRKKDYEAPGVLAMIDGLRAAGVEVRAWHDPRRPYDTNHRKMLVVDEEALLIGGRNIADHYAGERWRDIELLVTGPTARRATALFERTFRGDAEPLAPSSGDDPGVLFATTPESLLTHANFVYLLQRIRAARRTVDIENAYLFAHGALVRQIDAARRRGVRVRLLTNSVETNDLDYANHRLYTGFRALLDAGAELSVRRGEGRTLHCKYFVADGEWVSLGSSNLDYYSPRFCTEVNVQAHDPDLGARLTGWFEAGLADATRLTDRAEIDAVLRVSGVSRAVDRLLRDTQ
jgi:phosphatidylserine/phosphatidylglycerophosphate/cardiolipin synthase-like enzyme